MNGFVPGIALSFFASAVLPKPSACQISLVDHLSQ